jgi:ribosomal protein L16 Arg81 hydroxylase
LTQREADPEFGLLIAPLEVGTFFEDHWERAPLHLARGDPLYYDEVLSLRGVDEILSGASPRSTYIRTVSNGTGVAYAAADHDAAGPDRLYAQFRDGATVVMEFLHERWKPLADLCAALSRQFSARVQANGYLTPPNAQGFATHYDTHDVLVVQLAGQKRWQMFGSPTRLPLIGQPYREDRDAPREEPRDILMSAGDLLYVPRGFVHKAVSMDATSLHLTLGVLSTTYAGVLLPALESLIERDARFRESLPVGLAHDETAALEASEKVETLLGVLVDELSCKSLVEDATRRARLGVMSRLDGHLVDLEAEPSLGLGTWVRRRLDVQSWVERDEDKVVVEFHGKQLRLPGYLEHDVRWMMHTEEPFTAEALPGRLSGDDRLVLVRRLVREGLLTVPPKDTVAN